MNYPSGRWRQTRGLRIRPVPELKRCCVYLPMQAQLYWLNLNAWLTLELCDGSHEAMIILRYVNAVCPPMLPQEARSECRLTLARLADFGMIAPDESPRASEELYGR